MSVVSKKNQNFPKTGEKPLIIFDWDDTLFCTHWIRNLDDGLRFENCNRNGRLDLLEPRIVKELEQYYKSLSELLQLATTLAQVVIVTNAESDWIKHCVTQYIKAIAPLIKDIPVISARDNFDDLTCSPDKWKLATFRKLITNDSISITKPFHVISIGDSNYERQALWTSVLQSTTSYMDMEEFKTCTTIQSSCVNPIYRAKSIKLRQLPTLKIIIQQLDMLKDCLDYIVSYDDELDIEVDKNH